MGYSERIIKKYRGVDIWELSEDNEVVYSYSKGSVNNYSYDLNKAIEEIDHILDNRFCFGIDVAQYVSSKSIKL